MQCPKCKQTLEADASFCRYCGSKLAASAPVSKDSYLIGRAEDCDILLDNVRVSRHHARLTRQSGGWLLEDLGSKNGTIVNGKPISRLSISLSDMIVIAGVPLNLQDILSGTGHRNWNQNLRFIGQRLSYALPDKTIIDDVSLCFQPGQFVGLIGPSGCGKTTLMMMLNGYLAPTRGVAHLNKLSVHHNPTAFQGQIGYVPQDDIIHRELTVRESLLYTSQLRLGASLNESERQAQVDKILRSVELTAQQDVLIGSPEKKGISGGQRKRVNMAQELITEPLLYFLDEPTSGLDPRTDNEVMLLLKGIADSGHIVLLTTHKVDESTFAHFTDVIVLAPGGKLAYYGPSARAAAFFGVKHPEQIFDALSTQNPDQLKNRYLQSPCFREMVVDGISQVPAQERVENRKPVVNGFYQYLVLLRRNLQIKLRDTFSSAILLAQAPIIGIFMLLVFGYADNTVADYTSGLLFMMLVAAIWLGTSNSAREIVNEQTIFKREHKAALSVTAYLFSKVTILGVLCALQCLIIAGFGYASMSLNTDFGSLFGILWLTSFTATMMGLLISSWVKTGEAAMAIVPISLIPQVVMGGLIVWFVHMSEGVKILAGTMLSRWAFEFMAISEDGNPDAATSLTGRLGFNSANQTTDILVLLGMLLLFFLLSFFAIRLRKT